MDFSLSLTEYEQLLRPLAFNLTKSKEESDDLIQDTFYRALANREKFRDAANIRGWLYTIMRNVFINNYRRKKRGKVVADYSHNQFLLNTRSGTELNHSFRSFLSEEIEKAMASLSDDFRTPFMLHYQGYQYQEIAEMMKLPIGTVKSRIFSARQELQRQLKSMGIANSSYN
ncbi:MAG TPA: RNA polymerase sigma factor [Chitinophagales bacterium]|nr:RNA polymerase sigma factor [Chitinophagales bacterium]